MRTIYTDGACSNNGRSNATGGLGIYCPDDGSEHSIGYPDELYGGPTNNRCEMLAVITALHLYQDDHIRIYSDSKLLVEGINKWSKRWIVKGWKTSSNKPVKNLELWKELIKKCEQRTVEFVYVEAHVGIQENEKADELAYTAAQAGRITKDDVLHCETL